jgi:hypothetical protein
MSCGTGVEALYRSAFQNLGRGEFCIRNKVVAKEFIPLRADMINPTIYNDPDDAIR